MKVEELEKQSDDNIAFEGLAAEVPRELWEKAERERSKVPEPEKTTDPIEEKKEEAKLPDDEKKPVGADLDAQPEPQDELEKQFRQIDEDSKDAHPNVKKGISLAKQIAQAERKARLEYEQAVKDAKSKAEELEKKLQNPQMPDKEAKELEELRQLRREVDIQNDPQFKAKYVDQLNSIEESVTGILKQVGLKEEILQWIQSRGGILSMVTSQRMVDKETTEAQWVEDKLLAKAPTFYRDRIKGKLNQAYDLTEDMNKEVNTVASTAKERADQRAQSLKADFESGIKEEMEALGDQAKKQEIPATASPEQRELINKHNARVEKATAAFSEYLKTGHDQKTAAKLLVRAAHSQYLVDALKERDDIIKQLQDTITKIKASGNTSGLGDPADTTKPQQPDKKSLLSESDDSAVDRLMKT